MLLQYLRTTATAPDLTAWINVMSPFASHYSICSRIDKEAHDLNVATVDCIGKRRPPLCTLPVDIRHASESEPHDVGILVDDSKGQRGLLFAGTTFTSGLC